MEGLKSLKARLADVNALGCAARIMDWDQQTYMPPGGADARAEHVSLLGRMAHERFTSDELRKALDKARGEVDVNSDDGALIRVVTRDLDLATKLPSDFVAEKGRLSALAHEIWVKARAANDFKSFAPSLEKMFELTAKEAELLGYKDHIYDPLLDKHEEGATAEDARRMFETLKGTGVRLVKEIQNSGVKIDDSALYGDWDTGKQKSFTEMLVKEIGFDMTRGRQDTAPHPFCTGWSVNDIRLTTRFKPYIGSSIFGSLHEAGHGMYEQGSPQAWDRTPLAGGTSLGIHESQSRFWENIIGRSKSFWKRYLPVLQKDFPGLSQFDLESWYRAINKIEPSFIRVEADELTYNMHVLTRFELECDILTGKLAIKDLPDAWNGKYEAYLGVTPKTDSEGCLQDVHWSAGLIGYFPTYSMGNLMSYQFLNAMVAEIGPIDTMIEKGDFATILGWLQRNIYSKGRKYPPKELVMQVTGKPMGAEDYVAGLTAKYSEIYGLGALV